jgi:hypothetical protein
MSDITIRRRQRAHEVTVGTAVAKSSTIRFDEMAGAAVIVKDPSTAVSLLRVFGSWNDEGYAQLFDSSGSEATIPISRLSGTAVETVGTTTVQITIYTAQNAAYALPDSAFPLTFLRLVADAEIGTAATVLISAKS